MLFKLGGVDHTALLDYVEANSADFKLGVPVAQLRGQSHVNLWGFGPLLARGHADRVLSLERKELHYSGWVETGEAVINVTRFSADGTKAEEIARAEIALRKQVLEFLQFFRHYVPGCKAAFLAASAACVGVRESRRIRGLYELSDEDVRCGRRFPDAIARGGFPIDSHDAKGAGMASVEHVPAFYEIPFRVLVPHNLDALLVAGRCISASRKALASARITGTCMAMGQAAGTAAALAVKERVATGTLNIEALQTLLREQGALCGTPLETVNKG
jgi:hypothetical protein